MKLKPFDPAVFARRLRATRETANLTQEELGRMCGIPAAAVSHYECARRLPLPGVLSAICQMTGANPAWLLQITD